MLLVCPKAVVAAAGRKATSLSANRLPFPFRLLTLVALNPWHGLGLVEAWEARLLMLARLLCCHVGVLTQQQAHLPDK